MEVRPVRPGGRGGLRPALFDLLPAVGTRAFEPQLFAAMRAASGCSLMSAFRYDRRQGPRPVMAADIGGSPPAADLSSRYLAGYWRLDPLNGLAAPERRHPVLVSMDADDISDPAYRREFYEASGLKRRLSLVHAVGPGSLRLNLYFSGDGGGRWQAAFADASDLLLSLLAHHLAARPQPEQPWRRPQVLRRLGEVAPVLSPRETEICAGIILGQTSEAIALELGVGLSTVQEFRKRAYRKLAISSQNELIRLVAT